MRLRRLCSLPLCVTLLFPLVACAPKTPLFTPDSVKEEKAGWEHSARTWLFRHRVTVDVREKTVLAFDGLMRFDPEAGRVLAAGFASMMTLFVMEIDRHGAEVRRMHPGLRRISGIEKDIAACIRALWLNLPAPAAPAGFADGKDLATFLNYADPAGRYAVRVRLVDATYGNGS